jgi:hypothetical protein
MEKTVKISLQQKLEKKHEKTAFHAPWLSVY